MSAVAAPMPAASPSIEDLLGRLLEPAEAGDRARALLDSINTGLAGMLVADYACGELTNPRVYTFRQLCRHVFTDDHPTVVAARGHRLHTTVNVVPWHEELGGHGPGMKRGPS